MYITLETDYAIRIVDCLAQQGGRLSAQSIADATGVSLRFSLKILRKLVAAQLLKSFKGIQGGYILARPSGEISIHDILLAIEGEYLLSRCLRPEHECPRSAAGPCPYHFVFEHLSDRMREQLKEVRMDRTTAQSALK
jgi:Rrf2 family protein